MIKQIKYFPPQSGWKIEARWEIPGVRVNGKTSTYTFFEKLTGPMNAEQIAEHSRNALKNGDPRIASAPEVWACAKRACEEGNNDFLNFLERIFENCYPNTSSIAQYNHGKISDRVIHHKDVLGLEYSMEGNLAGPDGLITNISDPQVLKYVLETRDVRGINRVAQKTNGTNLYIWRENEKPKDQTIERVVGFGADSVRLYLYCGRDPHYGCPSFRVIAG